MKKASDFGVVKEGKRAGLYLLENKNGLQAYITDYGAALVRLLVPDKQGGVRDVVLGYDDVAGYEQGGASLGAVVGRNANRIAGAQITVEGVTYQLEKNDNDNNLHSGTAYYNKRFWSVTEQEEDHITFMLHSPDLDQGYPGALDMYVTYTLDDENMLSIHYEAVPDKDTLINMTNHSYFNLNGHNSGTVLNHILKLDADAFTPADQFLIPTGEIRNVEGTPMDFRQGRKIGEQIDADYEPLRFAGGYDHNWVLKNGGIFAKVAEVTSEESGITMEVYTDLPGIQVYTGNFLDYEPGKDNASYRSRSAVCLETQYYPDALHHDNFPQPLCRKDEKYETKTGYRFFVN